jgi:carboxypeptidase C (cathepsin A)
MIRLLTPSLFALLLALAVTEPAEDKLSQLPGYPSSFQNRAYAGYLSTDSELRKLHYIFIEADTGSSNSAPLTLWLNGGPGCASKIGFAQ